MTLHNTNQRRVSFTLVELMVVMTIIAIFSTAMLFALYGVAESARETRTKSQITKIHELIMTKWESYRLRAVPLTIPVGTTNSRVEIAASRLMALRDLMRMELPDRIEDLNYDPVTIPLTGTRLPAPALFKMYRRRAGYSSNPMPPPSVLPPAGWTRAHQGGECLYLILSGIRDGDKSGLEFFKETEFGDVDNDGMPEILDGWGNPIEFLRWAPGYSIGAGADLQWGIAGFDDDSDMTTDNIEERGASGSDDERLSDLNIPDQIESPDPFDPVQTDDDWRVYYSKRLRITFAQYPLIYSAGRDQIYDIGQETGTFIKYAEPPTSSDLHILLDPYYVFVVSGVEIQVGFPIDQDTDGELNHLDNVTNHLIETEL